MSSPRHNLTPDERQEAQQLWEALVGRGESKAAQQQLREAPAPIQRAIVHEIVSALRQGVEPHDIENPFLPQCVDLGKLPSA